MLIKVERPELVCSNLISTSCASRSCCERKSDTTESSAACSNERWPDAVLPTATGENPLKAAPAWSWHSIKSSSDEDVIYREFPNAYNNISSAFGNISSVKIYDKNKKPGGSYLRKAPKTKYYDNECKYQYSDGFVVPIFASLYTMMSIHYNKVEWTVSNPDQFIKDHLTEFVENYIESTIKDNDYNPNVAGKSKGGYLQVSQSIQMRILKSQLNHEGI